MDAATKWYVGVDWGCTEHRVCLLDAAGRRLGEAGFASDAAGLSALCDWVRQHTGGQTADVLVGLERPGGVLVAALLAAGLAVYAINPMQLDRFRDRFSSAGAKDDRRDALVLADSLRTDAKAYRPVRPEPAPIATLRGLERLRAQLQQELLRVASRLRDALAEYFPAALGLLADNQPDRFVCTVLELTADPLEARRKPVTTWARILRSCRVTRLSAAEVADLFRREAAPSLPGVSGWGSVAVRDLVAQWRLLDEQFRSAERQIEALLRQLDAPCWEDAAAAAATAQMMQALRSMPAVGPVILSTLLGEAWHLLRERDVADLRNQSGVAPVTRQSGRTRYVVRRRACNARLRHAVYHWARAAAENHPTWRARYHALRARGLTHARALRTIGDRLLRILVALLGNHTTYDPARLGPPLATAA